MFCKSDVPVAIPSPQKSNHEDAKDTKIKDFFACRVAAGKNQSACGATWSRQWFLPLCANRKARALSRHPIRAKSLAALASFAVPKKTNQPAALLPLMLCGSGLYPRSCRLAASQLSLPLLSWHHLNLIEHLPQFVDNFFETPPDGIKPLRCDARRALRYFRFSVRVRGNRCHRR